MNQRQKFSTNINKIEEVNEQKVQAHRELVAQLSQSEQVIMSVLNKKYGHRALRSHPAHHS